MPVNCRICQWELADYDKSSPFFVWRIYSAIFSMETQRF